MKKVLKIAAISLLGLIFLVLILLFTVPVIFKDKIKTKVETVISQSVNAKVKFEDYKLGFFRNFPNLSFGLENVSFVGIGKFDGDTLAGFRSFDLVFNLSSLFKKSGYEVKSVILDKASINAIVLKDGSANWDIMKETPETAPENKKAAAPTSSSSSNLKVLLKRFSVLNSRITYNDASSKMSASLSGINFNLSGDMSETQTDMQISMKADELTFMMDGVKYLNKALLESKIDVLADMKNMKFTFRDNFVALNDLKLKFAGSVSMPGNNIETDIQFGTDNTSFKTLLSLVPAVYMADYKNLTASGEFKLNGSAKGVYSSADSTLPDVSLAIKVKNGIVSYPALPYRISNINISSDVFVNGKKLDKTTVNVDLFHFDLAGNPFDMTMTLKTPISDPDFSAALNGKLDLSALAKAVPLQGISISGLISMAVKMSGRYSMIEKAQYDKFQASGTMGIKNMLVAMKGYPEVSINEAAFEFTPAYAAMTKADLRVGGKSDFSISGRLENYIPYILKNKTIKGNMTLTSNLVDVNDILSKTALAAPATTTAPITKDTASLTVISVPRNIDFDFNALINSLIYEKINAQNVKGHIVVRDGILSLKETGMNILGGYVSMNADYDTRDTLKPSMKADFNMQNIGIRDAVTTFNTIRKLAPAAKDVDGKVNAQLSYLSLLGHDMMPVIKTIDGSGKLQSDEVTLIQSAAFDKMKEVLKLGNSFSNTFKDLNLSFKINNGRIYVNPFDTKVGNIKMNISGDQGLDQTLNYLVKTEIPRADLGSAVNSLVDNLSAKASSFGFSFKPADVLKVNVRITGVFGKPVVTPVFGNTSAGSTSGTGESAKQTVVTGSREMANQAVASGSDELVSQAEAKGQQIRDQAASAADKIRGDAAAKAQNLVDGASSKGTIARIAAQKAADVINKEADKKATALTQQADLQASKLVEEAKAKQQQSVNNK
ncbi:MAG: AsmA-like C-terminal region-containing protein [Bacteroidales bacterium]|jgi:hypothetical protein